MKKDKVDWFDHLDVNTLLSQNDSNVQMHRSNFISSQSFLLAVGAITLRLSPIITIAVSLIAIFLIWFVWLSVIRSRCKVADFYKYGIGIRFNEFGNLIDCEKFKGKTLNQNQYMKDKKLMKKVWKQIFQTSNGERKHIVLNKTRFRLDVVLPIAFTLIWILYIYFSSIEIFI